jgi:eukaryotic-like serine/threonine-protein kinase
MSQTSMTLRPAPAHIFISYARKDNESDDPRYRWLDRFKDHLRPLASEGLISTFSDHDIGIGESWNEKIQENLTLAKVAVLLVSPAFLASEYIRNNELPALLKRLKDQGVVILPIILRPCLFTTITFKYPDPINGPERFSLADLQASNPPNKALNELDEAQQDRVLLKVAQRIQSIMLENRNSLTLPAVTATPGDLSGTALQAKNDRSGLQRQRLIRRVRNTWIEGMLQQSLYRVARIQLGLESKPQALEKPWDLVVYQPGEPSQPLPRTAEIRTVFDDFEEALLILGVPGAGKTVLLLELAQNLLKKAEQDPTLPIPAVFHLSTWASHQGTLDQWLSDELNKRYDVPREIGRGWIANGRILPLLDGLDEVAEAYRDRCVAAINAYYRQYGALVVCSRTADYEVLQHKLNLRGAIAIEPLSRQQVDTYLEQIGEPLAGVRSAVHADETLWELLDTPLMLSVASMAYRGKSTPELATTGTLEGRRKQLFASYVDAMFQRPGRAKQRNKDLLYSKEHTVSWLSWLASAMKQHDQTVLYLGWMQPSWFQARSLKWLFRLGVAALCGLTAGVIFGSYVVAEFGMSFGVKFGPKDILEIGLFFVLVGGLMVSIKNAGVGALIGALIVFGLRMVGFERTLGTPEGMLIFMVFFGLCFWAGVKAFGNSGDIRPVEVIRWSWGLAKESISRWMRVGAIIGSTAALLLYAAYLVGNARRDLATMNHAVHGVFIWILFLTVGLFLALMGSAIGGFLGGALGVLVGGLSRGDIASRTFPNEEIHRSLRVASIGVLAALCLAGVGLLVSPTHVWFIGYLVLILALVGGLRLGGLAAIQHYTLRVILWGKKYAPLNYVRFLDHATDLVFLHRVGGGYIFIHRMLLDYFSTLNLHAEERSATSK